MNTIFFLDISTDIQNNFLKLVDMISHPYKQEPIKCMKTVVLAKTSNALFPAFKERPIAGSGYITCESKIYFKKI